MIVNKKQIENYKTIFGMEKINFLWDEFLSYSVTVWEGVEEIDPVYQRTAFHNWRSSSLVFGMEDFSQLCTKIEEDILKNRVEQLSKQIKECKKCYEESIKAVAPILKKLEQKNER